VNATNIFSRLLPDLSQVFGRFPVAALATVALWLFVMVNIANGTQQYAWEAGLGIVAAFLGAGIGHLLAEGRKLSRFANLIIAAGLGVAMYAIYTFYLVFQTAEQFLFAGLGLAILIAPFCRRRVEQGAIWLFGQRMGLAGVLAVIVGVVFGAGLSAIVATLEYLLGFRWPVDVHTYIWTTAICLIGPLYGLSLVPDDFDEEIDIADHRNSLIERGVSVLVNYVITPLVTIYSLVIHAYAVKIIALWELPKGEIGTIVSLFAFASTAAWLISWPWRENGTWLLRKYSRYWFWLIPVPAVLLVMAVWRRVSDYGFTPDRYGLAVIAAWVFILFAYLLIRRNKGDMRVVIGTMSALLLAGSFGPWGAYAVTARDQMARLNAIFADVGFVRDNKLVLPPPSMASEKRQKIFSLIQTLAGVQGLGPVLAMLPEKDRPADPGKRFDTWNLANDLHAKLGVQNAWQSESTISFSARKPLDLAIPSGMRLMGPYSAYSHNGPPMPDQPVVVQIENNILKFSGKVLNQTVGIVPMLDKLKHDTNSPTADIVIVDLADGAKIAIYEAHGDTAQKEQIGSLTFWLMVKG
jgi:Domain of unknown function (DUF4153)